MRIRPSTRLRRAPFFPAITGISTATFGAGLLLLAACQNPPPDPEQRSEEPEKELAFDTVNVTEAQLAKGEEVFNSRCTACHAQGGEGRVGIGPRLNSKTFLEAASDKMLLTTIRQGRQGTTMAPWGGQLKPSEIQAVVAYIRSLSDHERAELDESPVSGDAQNGAEIFRNICSGCHGRSGRGYQESASGTAIGTKPFLDAATNGYLRHIIKHGKSQTKMRPFREDAPTAVANLTDQEIEDVIAYLRANAS